MSVASDTTLRLLRLSSQPGVGAAALRKIVALLQRDRHIADADLLAACRRPGSSVPGKQDAQSWVKVVDDCDREDITILSPLDETYPKPLSEIEDYPSLIYAKGNLHALAKRSAAVVGTREASRIGLSWARQIAEIFAQHDYSVVSGLALGIDTAAHTGALKANGLTVAILAHGLDKVTPASNRDLSEEILINDGALISEHAPGVPPRRAEYVRRNRIQSGMSVCSVVVESGATGGAIHQANFTRTQGRILFCVTPDGSIPDAAEFRYEGAYRLIHEFGAVALATRGDLLKQLEVGLLREPANAPPARQPSFL